MARAGLDGLIDACCVSELVGHRKPDPAISRIAADRCGDRIDGSWVIGDSPQADIGGAVAAGIDSVWIARGRRWSQPAFAPTLQAAGFAQAVDAILTR